MIFSECIPRKSYIRPLYGTSTTSTPRLREHHRKGDRKNVRAFWIWHHHWTDCSSGYLYKIKPTGKPIHIRQLLLDTVGFNNNNNTSKREDMEIEVGHFIHTHRETYVYTCSVYICVYAYKSKYSHIFTHILQYINVYVYIYEWQPSRISEHKIIYIDIFFFHPKSLEGSYFS